MKSILLALAIPGLGCAVACAQTTGANPLATARVFSFDEMTAKTAPNGSVGRNVFNGTLATGEAVGVHETMQPAGTVPTPAHRIQHSEVIVVEEGILEFEHDGKTDRAAAGSIIYVALGTLHTIKMWVTVPPGTSSYRLAETPGNNRGTMFDLLKSCIACLLLAGFGACPLFAQTPAAPEAAPATTQDDLLRSFAAEEKKGDTFFYTQSYYALHGRHVMFKGSMYGVIADVKVSGCRMRIDTTIADRYSGAIGRRLVDPTQSLYRISAEFLLTPQIAQSLKVVKARPGQLDEGTHPACSDHQPCVLNWIEISSEGPEIQVAEFTNDFQGYDGFVKDFDAPVDRFLVPVSSPAAGNELISKMQVLAAACGH